MPRRPVVTPGEGPGLYSGDFIQPREIASMKLEFNVQNVKCGGCASAIQAGLRQDARIREVTVDIPTGRVVVEAEEDIRTEAGRMLQDLGYPEKA